jgi:pyrroline-5-carboxylate reductase
MKISFIGFGNMAKAMAKGLLRDKKIELRAASPSLTPGVNKEGIHTSPDNLAVVAGADIIILAVKPMQMAVVFEQISPQLPPHCLVISVATGMSLTWFAKYNPNMAVVRAMPNIAAAISKSATPLIANERVTEEQKKWAEHIFTSIGITTWAKKEADIDSFTALSGSGPAYVFMFMESMIQAAIALGLSHDIAKSFALQTVDGALSLACGSSRDLVELRKMVTSPAGTTAAAIEVFTHQGFEEIIYTAMKAAHDRARALGSI